MDATVHNRSSLAIAAHEVAPVEDVQDAWPAVGVKWNRFSRRNPCIQHADVFILKEQSMVLRRGYECVKFVRPDFLVRHEQSPWILDQV